MNTAWKHDLGFISLRSPSGIRVWLGFDEKWVSQGRRVAFSRYYFDSSFGDNPYAEFHATTPDAAKDAEDRADEAEREMWATRNSGATL